MIVNFDPLILYRYFDKKTIEACRSCKRYNQKSCCPPKIEPMSYWQLLLPTYQFGKLVIQEYKINKLINYLTLGKCSSLELGVELDKIQLELEKYTYSLKFGGGSCKACASCSFPCKNPLKQLIPIEATGLNVIKLTSELAGVQLRFPIKTIYYRIGMFLYDTE
jgi:predicted metal-binding protein